MFSTLGILTAGVMVCLCIALFLYIQEENSGPAIMIVALAVVLFVQMVKISEKQEQQSCVKIQETAQPSKVN